jgi:hypothetical protein
MRYLKSYKIFEMWIDEPKFYRFSRVELPIGEYEPVERNMWGPENFNNCLVKLGFPDKNKCIHFMDSLAFSPDYKGLYGSYIYQIQIDDNSNLGWCYVFPINDWFYKGYPFQNALGNNKLVNSIVETPYDDLSGHNGDEDEMAKYLLKFGIIGCGTIDDLKNSPHYGKEKLFVWTNDKVVISNYQEPKKEPKIGTYKTERILTTDDFTSRGISAKEIGSFYQSELGKLVKDKTREEALNLLDQWVKKTHNISESVGSDLPDIFLEVNDETYWTANCWAESQDGKWIVVIKTVDEDDEYELEGLTPPPIVIESIERAIEFMNDEGFTNYQITFENDGDIYLGGSAEFEEINLEDVSGLDVWGNNFIRIEFWK